MNSFVTLHSLLTAIRSAAIVACSLFVLATVPATVLCQQGGGSVSVLVSDSKDTPLSQVEVRLFTFAQGNYVFRGFTDGAGRVNFNGVSLGDYYLEAVKPGYESARERIEVRSGFMDSFSLRLQIKTPATVTGSGSVNANSLAVPAEARAHFEKGKAQLEADAVESIKEFRTAIKTYPSYADAYELLGFAYFRNKQIDEAMSALRKAIELNSRLPFAHTLLGKIYLEEKKFKESEETLREAIRLDPNAWNAPYELARCYFNLERFDEALKYALLARDLPAASPTTHLLLVDIYLKKDDRRNALLELEKFTKADPQSPLMPRVRKMIERLNKPN